MSRINPGAGDALSMLAIIVPYKPDPASRDTERGGLPACETLRKFRCPLEAAAYLFSYGYLQSGMNDRLPNVP